MVAVALLTLGVLWSIEQPVLAFGLAMPLVIAASSGSLMARLRSEPVPVPVRVRQRQVR